MPNNSFDKKILNALFKQRLISYENFEQISGLLEEKNFDLDHEIIKKNLVREEDYYRLKGEVFTLPYIDLTGQEIPRETLALIPQETAGTYKMISFAKRDKIVQVALADPGSYKAREAVEFLMQNSSLSPRYFLTSRQSFEQTFKQYEELPKEVEKVIEIAQEKVLVLPKEEMELPKISETPEAIKAAPVSRIISVIIRHAVESRASDIHIEPAGEKARVRYRVDGILQTALTLPLPLLPALVSRVKVLASLRLDETRRPQDGRIRVVVGEREIDLRISTLPLLDSEKIAMRILDASAATITFEGLGFDPHSIKIIKYAIGKPHGIFLITGPTGSGKTTTLYAGLNLLNQEKVNIVTIEDPIEYFLPGVNQSQINSEVGLTFAAGLRSILRQDPNIIMVGEIRDTETAELVIHAGLTGHLVLTTLHTKDSFGAIPRLLDMGVEPFLIASTLNAVSAQRLVRKICSFCKERVTVGKDLEQNLRKELSLIPPQHLRERQVFITPQDPLTVFRGKGCPHCQNTGYQGRLVISEFLVNTEQLQGIIQARCPRPELIKEFRRQGMLTMKEDGLIKTLQGVTSIEELLRVIQE